MALCSLPAPAPAPQLTDAWWEANANNTSYPTQYAHMGVNHTSNTLSRGMHKSLIVDACK